MAFEQETKAALRILDGITEATMSSADSIDLVENADPALIYLLFTWIRHRYGPSHPASDAVLGRLVAISNRPSVAAKMRRVKRTRSSSGSRTAIHIVISMPTRSSR